MRIQYFPTPLIRNLVPFNVVLLGAIEVEGVYTKPRVIPANKI